jgi:hypothetical protein
MKINNRANKELNPGWSPASQCYLRQYDNPKAIPTVQLYTYDDNDGRIPLLIMIEKRNVKIGLSVQEADRNRIFSTIFGNLTLFLAQNVTVANETTEQLIPDIIRIMINP